MKTLLIALIAIVTFSSCSSTRNDDKKAAAPRTKLVRVVQVYKGYGNHFVCLDSSVALRRVDTLYKVGDIIKDGGEYAAIIE